ncbi:glycine--tRNA ligase subunit beta [Chromatiales bacterium (ex Bugula neritina AB1)]|nr:glycine--tRNA ligase subunit beta [Chromatiales bacterium (ex Bugula neritina AB1)]
MADRADFLVELGTEELPPKALQTLASAFAEGINKGLQEAKIDGADTHVYASPRRLAVQIADVPTRQADSKLQKRGPAIAAAFDDKGEPSKAAMGFARSCGVEVADLDRMKTDKGEWLVCNIEQEGADSVQLLPDIVAASLAALPIPKRMRWGDSDIEFVRPVHWLLMLLGENVVPATVLGLESGRTTRGHRFHHSGEISIGNPSLYRSALKEQGKVIADFKERRQIIAQGIEATAKTLDGEALVDEALLDEVTALVEWPVPVAGEFEAKYLDIPSEVLITTMKDNQKYFPLFDSEQKLMPLFITISNIESTNPDKVRIGNEVVIRPRLADAMFFWQQDRKKPLQSHIEALKNVVFQTRLGSVYDKTVRVGNLARTIAAQIGADAAAIRRAAELSKCDLMTEMVGEFPSVQGIMGEYYATLEKEPEAVSRALSEQYLPRNADDHLPATGVGQSLAIADRLDTLVGIFAIGQKPTGVKDPFALRRLALAVLRTLIERDLELDLEVLLKQAADGLNDKADAGSVVSEVFDFMLERLRGYYSAQGVTPQIFEAVASVRPTSPSDFDQRIKAVVAFSNLPEAQSLAAANKRISNILKKNKVSSLAPIDEALFENETERKLHAMVLERKALVEPMFATGDYTRALLSLAALREPVDVYFEEVMVMADDPAVRDNRLAVLSELRGIFSHVAELGGLQS